MRTAAVRTVSVLLAAVFVLSSLVSGTLGWQSLNQQAKNEAQSDNAEYAHVELLKLEKLPDGTKTQNPVPGAAFFLFIEGGEQLGGRYVTDSDGKISVRLEPGEYYFEEIFPSTGFSFDKGADGTAISRYPLTVTGEETEPVTVTAYNVRLQGALSVQKLVQNADGSPLSEAQKQQAFVFDVTVSDGGTYTYSIDNGEPQLLTSGGTLTLRHGQTAVFESLPVGVTYSVTEQPVAGYAVSGTGHRGSITQAGSTARFTNLYAPGQTETGSLTVSKEVKGEGADLQMEYAFTAVIGGQREAFILKHGESKTFPDLPVGTAYTVTEADYSAEGYAATVREYTGQITGSETSMLPFVNVYEPAAEPGSLTVRKEIVGDNADPDKEFTFQVTVSDGGIYEYTVDGGETQQLVSGGTLVLKGGQTAVLEDLPGGVAYTVGEIDAAGYLAAVEEITGTLVGGENVLALFQNRVPDEPQEAATIRVTKEVAGEYPEADRDKGFCITLLVDGEETAFFLKPGETKEFEVPAGAQYEVREEDYYADGYSQSITNGTGTARSGRTVEVTVTNTYGKDRVEAEIEGEKTWELGGYDKSVLPEAITVRLLCHGLLVEEELVTPDDNGEWHYHFTVPKYEADGEEIAYTVEEAPLDTFIPAYEGYNIQNTYLPPIWVDPPVIQKKVEGEKAPETQFSFLLKGENKAPMPEGSEGNTKIITLTGRGEAELGRFPFEKAGVYTYRVSELDGGEEGWSYDASVYTLTVTVTEQKGKLTATQSLEKNGQRARELVFINRYEEEEPQNTVEIGGTKTWKHGDNPEEKWPRSVIVEIYADGELAAQRKVTAKDSWKYAVELPRYAADGHEIVYTVDEAAVPGYDKAIHGYDLVNTYRASKPVEPDDSSKPVESDNSSTPVAPDSPSTPDNSSKPDNPGGPQTGDGSQTELYFALMVLSLTALLVTVRLRQRGTYRRNHRRR